MKHNKILMLLISLAVAFGLWVYVVTVEKTDMTETYYNVPVVLEGESILTERGLMIVDGRDTTVTLSVYGNRSDLRKINSGNITVIADLTRISEAGEVKLNYNWTFPGEVAQNALSVENRDPYTITLQIANRISNEIPVRINYVGEAPDAEKYLVDTENVSLDYPTITISGPDAVIDQIDHAEITVDLTDRNESFIESFPITLCDAEGNGVDAALVQVNTSEVRMELKIQRYKEVELSVAVIDGGGATLSTSNIRIEPKTIKVSGNEQVLAKLSQINLGTIDLSTLTQATELTFTINLDEGVTNLTGVTEATVTVSFPELTTKTFTITDIQTENVPEGLEADLATKSLSVTVRGPRSVINRMTENDISAVVDFTDKTIGTETHEVRIVIAEEFSQAGAVGTYSVPATLKEKTESTDPTE